MRLSSFVAVLLALASGAHAQSATDEPTFSASEVRAHIEFLADDAMEGRESGSRGDLIAANYVASRFRAYGLEPGGPDGSWFQSVKLAQYALDPTKPASLTIGGERFVNGPDLAIGATPRLGTGAQTLSAEAVFVGQGLADKASGRDDYAGVDARGKFAVMLYALPKGISPGTANALVNARIRIAGEHGAIGIIYVVGGAQATTFPWAAVSGFYSHEQTQWLSPEGGVRDTDPRIQIGLYARGAVAEALFGGAPLSAKAVFAAADKGKPLKAFALPAKPAIERTSTVKWLTSPNVMGLLRGSDPTLSHEIVLLTAHLDHVGMNPKLAGDQIFNGAMDNAAGTAAMLEAARGFAQSGHRPKRSILFVALTGEEEGLLGSDYLAHYPPSWIGKPVADVNLDMPILLYDFQDVVAFGAEHSTLGQIVGHAAAKMGVTLSPDPMPEEQFFVRSDHYSFVQQGVPSIFLMTGFKNGGEAAFRDFLKTHYHKVSDDAHQPFDWAAGAKFARINYLIAREIADGADAPRWYQGNEFGDRFAPDAPKAKRPADDGLTRSH